MWILKGEFQVSGLKFQVNRSKNLLPKSFASHLKTRNLNPQAVINISYPKIKASGRTSARNFSSANFLKEFATLIFSHPLMGFSLSLS
jgi:hypothetical protein